MRVALFGGSFDPPHRGHVAVARAAADQFALDKVLFAPTGLQPLKPAGATASFTDRLAMVEILCGADPRFETSSLDAPRADGQPNFTIDTLRQLRGELTATDELFVIVGADSFLDLRRWRSPIALLEAAKWTVVSRTGFSLSSLEPLGLTPQQRKHVHLLEGVEVPVSATDIREAISTHTDCAGMITADVYAYIREHGLYEAKSTAQ